MAETYKFGYWGNTSEEILRSQFPLHRACRDGDVEALSLFLVEAQHGIYEEDSFYGWTPAHWAAYFGKLACLRKLMIVTRVGVNCNIRTSRFKQTPAHLSAFGGHPQCLLWLLQYGAEMEAQDYLGETALHKAARTGSMECVSLLASHGARLFIRNNNGHLAADVAIKCGYNECSKYLAAATARQETDLGQAKGIFQASPGIHAVTQASPHDITSSTQKVEACVILQGINAGRLPPAGPGGDSGIDTSECDMEEEESQSATAAAAQATSDVTLHAGISANYVPVGGRKRTREDDDECDYKRMRTSDEVAPLHMTSIEMNGTIIGHVNGFNPIENRVDAEQNAFIQHNNNSTLAGPNRNHVTMQQAHTSDMMEADRESEEHMMKKPVVDDLDYSVGYDYCGVPEEISNVTPSTTVRPQQDNHKCSMMLHGHMI